jgi:hypothetical protein
VPPQDPNAPPQPNAQPKAYETPPDLSALYLELMNRDRNSREMDQGMTLIAAGLARDENRDRIMKTYPDAQDTPQSSMFNTLGLLQKAQQELLIKNQMRLALPRIAKEHGLSMEDVTLMFENGTLEEFLKSVDAPSYGSSTDPDSGQVRIFDQREILRRQQQPQPQPQAPAIPTVADDNTPVPQPRPDPNAPPTPDQTVTATVDSLPGVPVTGKKKREVEYIDDGTGTNTKVAVWKGTTDRVDGKGKVLTQPPTAKIEYMDGLHGRKIAKDANTGELMPDKDIPADQDIVFKEDANGQTQAFDSVTGAEIGGPMGPTKDQSTEDMKEWAKAYADAKANGKTYPEWPEYLDNLNKSRDVKPTSANYDAKRKVQWPEPPTDMTYQRDQNGDFVIDPTTNTPKVIPMPGTKLATEQSDKAAKVVAQKESKEQASAIVGGMVDKAISVMDSDSWYNPATGALAPLTGIIEGSNRAKLEEALSPIKASIAFEALAEMRANSPTGGALGNVSDIELRLLAATLGSIEPRQGADSLRENLKLIKGITSGDRNALLAWRKKYNPNGKDMTPEEKAAADKAYKDSKGAATSEEPPPGAKTRKYNPKTGKIE